MFKYKQNKCILIQVKVPGVICRFYAMTIREVAAKLVGYCREGKFDTAQKELYAADAISTEPPGSPGFQSVTGLEKIIEKGHQFQFMIETVHSSSVSDPQIAGDYFSIALIWRKSVPIE
jgi:hypothetical protein